MFITNNLLLLRIVNDIFKNIIHILKLIRYIFIIF